MNKAHFALALAGPILQSWLAVLLIRRRSFRFFLAYTIFAVADQVTDIVLDYGLQNHTLRFKFYWISEVFYILLGFLATYEIFHWVFRNFYKMFWIRALFPIVGILMLGIAGIRAALLPAPDVHRLNAGIISLEIAVGFLQVGIFALFFLLVLAFHIRWRQYAFGIALGFGIIAATDLAIFLLRSEFGKNFDPTLRITAAIAYLIAIVIWLAAFLRAEPEHPWKERSLALEPEEVIAELRRYTAAAKGVLKR